MLYKSLLSLALASTILAQNSGTPSLTEALSSQNDTLSTLIGILSSQPDLVQALGQAQNITILAPSNQALETFLSNQDNARIAAEDPGFIAALLQYHVLNGTYYGSSFTNTSTFIPTLLTDEAYANVTGGQRVEALLQDGNATIFSGLKENSTVVSANVNFTAGTIHIIDQVLNLPVSISATAQAANLTAALGAIQVAGVGEVLSELMDVTIFVPNNDAFNAIGNITGTLSTEQLAAILQYHVVAGTVAYSSLLENTTIETVGGGSITISIIDGSVYVNSAKVVIPDVLISNGVVHVIDNVLNPDNSAAVPDTTATSAPPAFTGAGPNTSGGVPFTTGVPTPTSISPVATSANPGGVGETSTSSQFAAAMHTGIVGAAALFGGAAAVWNM